MSEPRLTVRPWGNRLMVKCSDCGEVDTAKDRKEARQVGREHRRWGHPTEDEQAVDRIRTIEYSLPGCKTCGHSTHETKDCPNRPWMS